MDAGRDGRGPIKKPARLSKTHPIGPWENYALAAVLLLALFLRLWNISENGFANSYYAAAVRSMLMSWHNFFFASFDPVGFVSVDKPPLALWLQVLSAKLWGYSGFTIILPQILEGTASVWLVYVLTRRHFEASAALLAALTMALEPVCVAVDRYNNVDSCLILLLLLSTWAFLRAVEKGSRGFLLLSAVLVGAAFNTKMMAALIIIPTYFVIYLLAAPVNRLKRTADLGLALILLLAVGLCWPLAVDFTPPEQRPYVGSTQDNSVISLALGWNGFQRLLQRDRGFNRPESEFGRSGAKTGMGLEAAPGGYAGGGDVGASLPGPFRLAQKQMATQFAWFLPLAFWGLGMAARSRKELDSTAKARRWNLFLWMGWLASYALVLSFTQGTIHTYYSVLLAPPASVLGGIGLWALWKEFREGRPRGWIFPAGLSMASLWQTYMVLQYPGWGAILLPILWAGVLAACGLWAGLKFFSNRAGSSRWAGWIFGLGLASLLVCPGLWALSPVLGDDPEVEADPDLISRESPGLIDLTAQPDPRKLVDFLKAHEAGETYLLAAPNNQAVAPLIIQTGEPVVAVGGYKGTDPILTVDQFEQWAREGKVRYMLIAEPERLKFQRADGRGSGRLSMGQGGFSSWKGFQTPIVQWVRSRGKRVPKSLWWPSAQGPNSMDFSNPSRSAGRVGYRRSNLELYDLASALAQP